MNYAEQSSNPTRHLVGVGFVVAFHIVLIYALVEGLGLNIIEKIRLPPDAKIVREEVMPLPPPPPPPLAPPSQAAPNVTIPVPDIVIQTPAPPQRAIEAVARSNEPPQAYQRTTPGEAAPAQPDRDVSERPIAGNPLVYPAQMQDAEREGSARVSCFVGKDGRTSGCKVDSVTDGAAFGAAALSYVATARYQPRTHNGVAVAAQHQWNIRFSLGGGE